MVEAKRYFNKVALITGGASGIGRATVERFAREGAKIIIADADIKSAKLFAHALSTEGCDARAFAFQAESLSSCEKLARFALEAHGRVDILVNNVGLTEMARDSDLITIDIKYFDEIFHINLRSMIYLCKLLLPEMIRNKKGTIINIASMSGIYGSIQGTLYGATKAGVINLTRNISTQYSEQGIRCNAIAPGLVMTKTVSSALPENINESFERNNSQHILGYPEDIAATIAFLASDEARFITGQIIQADGGMFVSNPLIANILNHKRISSIESEKENENLR